MAAAGWVIVRLMAILPASAAGRRFRRRPSALLLLLVDDVRAAILRVGSFVAPAGARAFLTEAYRFHLLVAHAQHGERAAYRLGPLLAEGEVVLAAAAIVGVALDGDPAAAIGGQVAGMRLDQRAVLVLHHEAVELEVDAALGEDAGGIVERILPLLARVDLLDGPAGVADAAGPGARCAGIARFDGGVLAFVELDAGAAARQGGAQEKGPEGPGTVH